MLIAMHDVIHGLDSMDGIVHVSLDDLMKKQKLAIDHLIFDEPFKRKRRRRVLALRATDQQFHCGVVDIGTSSYQETDQSLIKFYPKGDHEWVLNDLLTPVSRKGFRILFKNNFPSLFAPEDIDAFDI